MNNEKKNFNEVLKNREEQEKQDATKENGGMKLDDTQRVKVLSPGRLVFRRFIRNRLAIVGTCILIFMFVFAFLGAALYPYSQTQAFMKVDIMPSYDYARASARNEYVAYNIDKTIDVPIILKAKGNSYIVTIEDIKEIIAKKNVISDEVQTLTPSEKLEASLAMDDALLRITAGCFDIETEVVASGVEEGETIVKSTDELKKEIISKVKDSFTTDDGLNNVASIFKGISVVRKLAQQEYFKADRLAGAFRVADDGTIEELYANIVKTAVGLADDNDKFKETKEAFDSCICYDNIVTCALENNALFTEINNTFSTSGTNGVAEAVYSKFTDEKLSEYSTLILETVLAIESAETNDNVALFASEKLGCETEAVKSTLINSLYSAYTDDTTDFAEKCGQIVVYSNIVTVIGSEPAVIKALANVCETGISVKSIADKLITSAGDAEKNIKSVSNIHKLFKAVGGNEEIADVIAVKSGIDTASLDYDSTMAGLSGILLNGTEAEVNTIMFSLNIFEDIDTALGIGTINADKDKVEMVAKALNTDISGLGMSEAAKAISCSLVEIADNEDKLASAVESLNNIVIYDENGFPYSLVCLGTSIYEIKKYNTKEIATLSTRTQYAQKFLDTYTTMDGSALSADLTAAFNEAVNSGKGEAVIDGVKYDIVKKDKNSYNIFINKDNYTYAQGTTALGEDFEAAISASRNTGKAQIGENQYIINAVSGDEYAVSQITSLVPAIVYTNFTINSAKEGFEIDEEIKVKAYTGAYTQEFFEYKGENYYFDNTDGTVSIHKGSKDGERYAVFSRFVVGKTNGLDTLSIDFKIAIEGKIKEMEAQSLRNSKFRTIIEKQSNQDASIMKDENGQIIYEDTDIYISRKANEYYITAPYKTTLIDRYARPFDSGSEDIHVFGTDGDGYDILARMMSGGRISLLVGFVVVIIETILGIIMGGIAGYFGGWVDTLIMRLVEVFYCIPTMPIMIILGAFFDSVNMNPYVRLVWLMATLGVLGWAGVARLVRGQILSLREQEFMVAAEATGIRTGIKIFKHLIPNVMPQLIVTATAGLGGVILTESTLSFLGLGVKHPLATWGTMINSVSDYSSMVNYTYIWVPVGCLICLTVIAFNFVGDGLRDAFDPKMKR